MAKKRGGIAGFWDRNKGWLKPVATGVAGLFNPLAAAAIGGAVGGLDRPGKGGIGFDVAKGALGAASGYAMGKSAQGLKGMFAPKAITAAGQMPTAALTKGTAAGMTKLPASVMPRLASAAPSAGLGGAAGTVASTVGNAAQGAGGAVKGSFLKDLFSPQSIGGIAEGTLGAIQGGQRNALERQRMAQEQERFGRQQGLSEQKFAEERRMTQLDEERRRKVASLMALFAPQLLRGVGIGGQAPTAQG